MPENFEVSNDSLKALLYDIGGLLKPAMPEGWGFLLMIFSFGEGGSTFYISDAQRQDVIKMLKEFIEKNEAK